MKTRRKLFAIVGYTNWGKSNTLYALFNRRQFFPLKSPIATNIFNDAQFTVINASNEDRKTADYLKRLKEVLSLHADGDSIYVITISLIFNNGTHDAKPVFEFLNSLTEFITTYIVLDNSWFIGEKISMDDKAYMNKSMKLGNAVYFSSVIDESDLNFQKRTALIIQKIKEIIGG